MPTVSSCRVLFPRHLPVGKICFSVKPLGEGDITFTPSSSSRTCLLFSPVLRQSCLPSSIPNQTPPSLRSHSRPRRNRTRGARARFNPSQDFCGVRFLLPDSARIEFIASHPLLLLPIVPSIWVTLLLSFFSIYRRRRHPLVVGVGLRPVRPPVRRIHLSSSLASTPLPVSLPKPAAFLVRPVRDGASSVPGVNARPCRGSQPPPLQIPSLFAPIKSRRRRIFCPC